MENGWTVLQGANGLYVQDAEGFDVCVISTRARMQMEIFARLIAAAPELVELLQKMVFLHGPRNAEETSIEQRARALLAEIEGK